MDNSRSASAHCTKVLKYLTYGVLPGCKRWNQSPIDEA